MGKEQTQKMIRLCTQAERISKVMIGDDGVTPGLKGFAFPASMIDKLVQLQESKQPVRITIEQIQGELSMERVQD